MKGSTETMRMVLLTCVSIGITSVMRPAFGLSLRAVGLTLWL